MHDEFLSVTSKIKFAEQKFTHLTPLADPAAGFRGGGNLGRGPNLGYPKTENSTDLTHYFLEFTFEKKVFGSFLGKPKDMMPPSWALGAGSRVGPPGSASV